MGSHDEPDDALGLTDVLPGSPTPGPQLLLGPVLRYADSTRVVIWAETSQPARLEVHGQSTSTFEVSGHHYAYLVVDGLAPGADVAYDVRLDGQVVWPEPDDPRPAPRLRTSRDNGRLDLVFGSCRIDRPHEDPWNLEPEQHPDGVGIDALQALARGCQDGDRALPDVLLMLGDQVYADEGLSPKVAAKQHEKRGPDSEPQGEVADFEEYTWLYLDSWSNPDVRWLLSTVPTSMVFDDHDVRDDWNISRHWRDSIQQQSWWHERITGAYMSYWLYQHLGNVSPEDVAQEGLLEQVRASGEAALRPFAESADDSVEGRKLSRWSYCRQWGPIRLVVIDTRSGRCIEDDARSMLSPPEWQQVEQWLTGDCTHLLVGSSLPVVLERSLHDLEQWNEAVAAGAWGRRAARWAERLRQGIDLEHWASFSASFDRLVERLRDVAHGRCGAAPQTVTILSGDVHHSYVAPLRFPDEPPATPVVQVVSSPMRNAFPRRMQRAFRISVTPAAELLGRALTAGVSATRTPVQWQAQQGPVFGNSLGALLLDGPRAELTLARATSTDGRPRLDEVLRMRLDAGVSRVGPGS